MENNTKRSVKKYVFLVLVLLLVAALTALPFALDKMNAEKGDGSSILSATVTRADISSTVSGTGTLEAKDAVKLTVPEGVVLTGYTVKDGDMVHKGDKVASVDRVSVYKTAAELGDALATVTEELSAVQDLAGKLQTVYSTVVGKVVAVYAEQGSDIAQVMREHGALAEIELDDGTVLKLTGTSGTISYFYFPVGTVVYVNAPIYAYTDAEGSGTYTALVQKHQKIEEQLAQLFQMYRDGYAVAPGDGMITGLDETLVKELGYADGDGLQVQLLGNFSLGEGMEVRLLEGETPESPETPKSPYYITGTLTQNNTVSINGREENVEGLDALLIKKPDAKPGDTVFLRCDVINELDDNGKVTGTHVVYTALLIQSAKSNEEINKNNQNSNMTDGMGGGGGGMGMGGSSTSGTAEEEQEATLATTLIASVIPMDEVLVTITVDELDILSLHEGDKALVTVDALPGHSFDGVVTGVNTSRSNNGGNSKYTVEVTMARSDDMLAGMNASCLVTVETYPDVLSIPAAALCDLAGGLVVYTALGKDDGVLSAPVPVEIGISDGERVEIVSGLTEGETIWYSIFDTPEYSVPSSGGGSPFGNRRF
ncbi:MAG: efflux RND transporter periplasmic adaptor subunit [Oscillospiraceae bacterium]|nr:efflux RND transporter periplasmic adaptor subunit [Oscillospiraceae bacterium]